MTDVVRVPRPIVEAMMQHARRAPDEEVCGLVAGRGGALTRCFAVDNVAADRRHRFEMHPKGQIDAMRAMREAGEELAAVYHSHPDSPALPSATDIARHEYPEALFLIVSLAPAGAPALRGFRIRNGAVTEVPLAT